MGQPDLPQGQIRVDNVVPARAPWSARLEPGEILRLIDLDGAQAVDFLCYNADDPAERYHAPNTIKVPKNIFIGQGSVLRSNLARPMMTVIADTCGRHDTIFGCCSFEVDRVRYGRTNAESCQHNFEREMARHGIGPEHVVPNVNFFMNVPVAADGATGIAESQSKAGDYVDLRAEMPVLAVLSNCPEELNPATGANGPTPIRAIVWREG
ncbi:MAG: urea carboxylase-associated family protein [Paracoccaceae bacterium]|nr:urea carboxylase-associated family protein [Paracoccaceae bacterium]